MIKCKLLSGCCRIFNNKRLIYRKVISIESSKNSYIVIPEIPGKSNVTIENNSSKLCEMFINFSRSIHDFETELSTLVDKLSESNTNLNFENSILKMEDIIRDTDLKFRVLKSNYYKNDHPISKSIFGKLLNKMLIANLQINSNPKIYKLCVKLLKLNLNEHQTNYLNNILSNGKIYGIELSSNQRYLLQNSVDQVFENQISFMKSINHSVENAVHYINMNDMCESTPSWVFSKLKCPKSEDLLLIDIKNKEHVNLFLKYCKDHKVRNQIWLLLRQVGGKALFDFKQSNYTNIENIRTSRRNIAKILGQKNYCDVLFNFNKRMAKSLDEVMNVLQTSKDSIMPDAEYEYKHILEYAVNEKGLKGQMLMCDYNYVYNDFTHHIKKCPWTKVRRGNSLLNFQTIIARIFFIIGKIFNISFKDLSENKNEMSFSVSKSNNEQILGKINFRQKESSNQIFNMVNISEPQSIRTFVILVNLFNEKINFFDCLKLLITIGNALELIHNNIDFEIATLYSRPPQDAQFIVPYFLLHLFVSSKHIFAYLFSELSKKELEDLNAAYISPSHIFLNNVELLEILMHANFDLEMWISKSPWRKIQSEMWSSFFTSNSKLSFPYEKSDEWPCSANKIFADHIWGGASIYSYFWVEHILKLIMVNFTTAGLHEWNPAESINPELAVQFIKFKELFIEDQLSNKSKTLNHFLN